MISDGRTEINIAQQGEVLIFEHFEDGGPMWEKEGERTLLVPVIFDTPFMRPPVVTLSLTLLDVRVGKPVRYYLTAENITPKGFDISFSTWKDTQIARVSANWLAIGATVRDEFWVDF